MKSFITSLLVMSLTMPAMAQEEDSGKKMSERLIELSKTMQEGSGEVRELVGDSLNKKTDLLLLKTELAKYSLAHSRISVVLAGRNALGGEGTTSKVLASGGLFVLDGAVASAVMMGAAGIIVSADKLSTIGWKERNFKSYKPNGLGAKVSRFSARILYPTGLAIGVVAFIAPLSSAMDNILTISISKRSLEETANGHLRKVIELESEIAALEQN